MNQFVALLASILLFASSFQLTQVQVVQPHAGLVRIQGRLYHLAGIAPVPRNSCVAGFMAQGLRTMLRERVDALQVDETDMVYLYRGRNQLNMLLVSQGYAIADLKNVRDADLYDMALYQLDALMNRRGIWTRCPDAFALASR